MKTAQKKTSGKKKRAIPSQTDEAGDIKKEVHGVIPHNHCYNCGISTPPGKEICSDTCQVQWDKMIKRKKMITYLPIIGGVLLILFYILVLSS